MNSDDESHVQTLGGGLALPSLPQSTGRANVYGNSPICVGDVHGTRSLVSAKNLGHLLDHNDMRSNSNSPPLLSVRQSPSPQPRSRSSTNHEEDELRNLARQPSTASCNECGQSPCSNQCTGLPNSQTQHGNSVYGTCTNDGRTKCDVCKSGSFTPHMEDMFRRRLRFFFMNPYQKWTAKRRFPYKLLLQLIKIILVTLQLVTFGSERGSHVEFLSRNNVAFKHLFLRHWNSGYETLPYPPSTGPFSVYEKKDFLDSIDYTLKRYNESKFSAIGSYDFAREDGTQPPVELWIHRYVEGRMFPHNETISFNSTEVDECYNVTAVNVTDATGKTKLEYNIREFLKSKNRKLYFDRLNKLELKFSLKTVHLKTTDYRELSRASCFQFNIMITYDNSLHNGQVTIDLTSSTKHIKECSGGIARSSGEFFLYGKRALDVIVICLCTLSLLLCLRTLYRGRKLKQLTVKYFKARYNKELPFSETSAFLNLWDYLILVNDMMIVSGSVLKIVTELKGTENYEICGMLLGTANLLVWMGVLRYLSFFEHYNILILTMKQAIPDILRFLVCAAIFYMGFAFCGWIVLGPYNIKFATLGESSECLFALVNGDEIFVTYAGTLSHNMYIYLFSRVYLYLFISLFMYVVYSLFTSIIITTYETIKYYYREGFPKTELQKFIAEHHDQDTSPLFRADDHGRAYAGACSCCMPCFACLCPRNHDSYPDEFTALIN